MKATTVRIGAEYIERNVMKLTKDESGGAKEYATKKEQNGISGMTWLHSCS